MRIAIAVIFFASLMAAQSDVQAVPSCAAARIAIPQGAFATPIIVPSEAKDGVVSTLPPCGYPEGAAVRPPRILLAPGELRKRTLIPRPLAAPAPSRKLDLIPNPFAAPAPPPKLDLIPNPFAAPAPPPKLDLIPNPFATPMPKP
jgi:hypothetical protein